MLHVHTAQRLENLAEALGGVLATQQAGDPLARPVVAIPSQGLERWLARWLARGGRVVWNLHTPFLAEALGLVVSQAWPQLPPSAAVFERGSLPWALDALLATPAGWQAGGPLTAQLDPGDAAARHALAQSLAGAYDRYFVFRAEWLERWEQGETLDLGLMEGAQAALWRALRQRHPGLAPHERLLAATRSRPTGARTTSPLAFFGFSSLPPRYLQVLEQAGAQRPIHLFQLAPSSLYWGDLETPKAQARRALRRQRGGASSMDAPLLLQLWGRQTRECTDLLLDLDAVDARDCPDAASAAPTTWLAHLQRVIAEEPGNPEAPGLPPHDPSIQVHAAPGPRREVEALHDALLHAFRELPGLRPDEVVVLCPTLEAYAPYIEGVFGNPEAGAPRLPHSLADRPARASAPLLDAWMRALELVGGRYPTDAVLDVLGLPGTRAAWGLTADDDTRLRRWIAEAGTAWGLDADHRERLHLPRYGDHSWQALLDSLVLGSALADSEVALHAGQAGLAGIEGDRRASVDRLVSALGRLLAWDQHLREPRSLPEWVETLRACALEWFGTTEEHQREGRIVLLALDRLLPAELALPELRPPFAVVREALGQALDRALPPRGFLGAGITFCDLQPMRAVPARVIAVLGLNDREFPRPRPQPLDLCELKPARGDRSAREDDRALMLETVLAARERLILCHTGADARDLTPRPASLVVDEILQALQRLGAEPERFVRRHPLQAFSPEAFNPQLGPPSHAAAQARIARQRREAPTVLVATTPRPPLPADHPAWHFTPEELVRFLSHPAQGFLKRRLGIAWPYVEDEPEAREPLTSDRLEVGALQRRAHQALLRESASATTAAAVVASLRARGQLPPLAMGNHLQALWGQSLDAFCARWQALVNGRPTESRQVAFTHADPTAPLRVTGALTGIHGKHLLRWVAKPLNDWDRVRLLGEWAVALSAFPDLEALVVLDPKEQHTFARPSGEGAPRDLWTPLAQTVAHTLIHPAALPPRSALAWVAQQQSEQAKTSPLDKANETWLGNAHSGGEGNAEDWRRALNGPPQPLEADPFAALAAALFLPLIA